MSSFHVFVLQRTSKNCTEVYHLRVVMVVRLSQLGFDVYFASSAGNPTIPTGAGIRHVWQKGADVSLVPEKPCTLPSYCCGVIEKRRWNRQQVILLNVNFGKLIIGCNLNCPQSGPKPEEAL